MSRNPFNDSHRGASSLDSTEKYLIDKVQYQSHMCVPMYWRVRACVVVYANVFSLALIHHPTQRVRREQPKVHSFSYRLGTCSKGWFGCIFLDCFD